MASIPSLLRFTTCQAENTAPLTAALAAAAAEALGVACGVVDDILWQERYEALETGRIEVGWICGAPFAARHLAANASLELLALPVMALPRYAGRPVYFADMIVRAGSPFHTLADLRGRTVAINEPGSLSGCHALRFHLAEIGEPLAFFGRVVESGGHAYSVEQVLAGEVDTAAIDSTVLEWLLARQPALRGALRIVTTLGPHPFPPLVVQRRLPRRIRNALRGLLLDLHNRQDGRQLLAAAGLRRFAPPDAAPYRAIASQLVRSRDVRLAPQSRL